MKYLKQRSLPGVITTVLAGFVLSTGSGLALAQNETDVAKKESLLEEVTVTARKIKENIQEVPVAITSVSADMIDRLNIMDLSDISKITPGLVFENELGRDFNRPVIRGQANIQGSSGASYFIDGVYISGSIGDYDLNDVERMEVVKGPQSALYGRNTYSGAINIITKSPGEEMSGRVKVEVAEDDQYDISASIRGPITDTVSGSITARYYSLGGPFTNAWNNDEIGEQESTAIAGVLEFNPSDKLRIRARAYFGHTQDGQPSLFGTYTSENNCYFDNGALYAGRGRYYCGVLKPQPIDTNWPQQAPGAGQDNKIAQTSVSIDYELSDAWSMTSITGYNTLDHTTLMDGDYHPSEYEVANFTPGGFPIGGFADGPPFDYGYVGSIVDFTYATTGDDDEWSEELRFNYTGDRFNVLIGGYYYDGTFESRDNRTLPPGAQASASANYFAELAYMQSVCAANFLCGSMVPLFGPTIPPAPRNVTVNDIRNLAAFGMITYDITDTWGLTVEARYASEKVQQTVTLQTLGQPVSGVVVAEETFDSFNPRVTLDWQVTDKNMLYVLYAEGNKPGGFNGAIAIQAGLPTYDEEEVKSIEFGSKNLFMDGQMIFNFAAYFNRVTGYQLTQNARTGTITTSATTNAGDAEIKGFEASVTLAPDAVEGLTITTSWAYTDPKFTKGYDENQGLLEDVADDGLVNCSTGNEFPDTPGCTPLYGSIVGQQIPRTAKNQVYFDLDYRRPFANLSGWSWFVGANYYYESSKYSQVANLAETGSASLVGARAGMYNDRWNFQLWGRNLTGEDSVLTVLRYADPSGFTRNFVGSPRRDTYFGLKATMNFGAL